MAELVYWTVIGTVYLTLIHILAIRGLLHWYHGDRL